MKQVSISKLADGTLLKRKIKSGTWFTVITKGKFGVVVTSKNSNYSALLKGSEKVYIKE